MKRFVAWLGWTAVLFHSLAEGPVRSSSQSWPFFAFQNGLNLPPAELAATLKELGYDGLSTDGYDVQPHLKALQSQGLRLFNTYLGVDLDADRSALSGSLRKLMDDLQGSGAALWLSIPKVTTNGTSYPVSSPEGDPVAVQRLAVLANYAEARGLSIALYPHTGCWLERVSDAVRVADQMNRPGIGVTFNLCHWLKVEGAKDPLPTLRMALPRLRFVSINGADGGDTRTFDWKRLIQPLDQGSYDVGAFLASLKDVGYTGPIGLQGYGMGGDSKENARRSMAAWQRWTQKPNP